MPYIVLKQSPIYHKISLEETWERIIEGPIEIPDTDEPKQPNGTVTRYVEKIKNEFKKGFDVIYMINALHLFNERYADLFSVERSTLYRTFHIPKKKGGLRRIDAPNDELMGALRELKSMFEIQFTHTEDASRQPELHHTTAFAYVKGRSTVDAVRRHQMNESKWFVKFDFHNFFGSTTEEFAYNMITKVFPFSSIAEYPVGAAELKQALSLCFLNGGLPQGTPASPFITNIMMIPIDHELNKFCRSNKMVYTRYADDILISSKYNFDWHRVQNNVNGLLARAGAPFRLNETKTRYGSSAGRNWNLGLMLNKDNEITIGNKNKKTFKAMVFNYINSRKSGIKWEGEDIQKLAGLESYYTMIEPEYIKYIIEKINEKTNADFKQILKADLKAISKGTL